MRYQLVLIALIGGLLCGYQAIPNNNSYPGVLYRWSGQTVSSDKVILFVHGRRMDISDAGPDLSLLESIFSFKITNFESIGRDELFGQSTSAIAEYWFYGYYPQQSPEVIAADLAQQIQANPDLRGKQIAVVGYSEGGLVCWLLDQRYDLIEGGVLLGAPILGTPLANKPIRDAAVQQIVSERTIADQLINFLNQFTAGAGDLKRDYSETGQPRSELAFYAGRILSAPLRVDVLDIIIDRAKWGRMMETSNRRMARLTALIISQCRWREQQTTDWQSDGTIPVSSATCGGIANSVIWEEYDHYDLLTGAGGTALDRATLQWLDQVLRLGPEFAETDDLPQLPDDNSVWPNLDIPELPEINLSQTDLLSYRFAYIHNGNPAFTNQDWSSSYELEMGGNCSYPRFAPDGKSLVFTAETDGISAIYRLTGNPQAEPIVTGRYADFSPNGKWLTYEGSEGLCTWRFSKQEQYCIVENVRLICPPLWVVKGLLGRIYFAAQADDGSTNLYVVSPRARHKTLSELDIVTPNCQGLFVTRGWVSGVVAINSVTNGYRLAIVSNVLQANISFEIDLATDGTESFAWDGLNFTWATNQASLIQSAVLDQTDSYALYLEFTDETTGIPGIYLFNLQAELSGTSLNFNYQINEVADCATQLDLNPAAIN